MLFHGEQNTSATGDVSGNDEEEGEDDGPQTDTSEEIKAPEEIVQEKQKRAKRVSNGPSPSQAKETGSCCRPLNPRVKEG